MLIAVLFLPLIVLLATPALADGAAPDLPVLPPGVVEKLGPWGILAIAAVSFAARHYGPAILDYLRGRAAADDQRAAATAATEAKRDEFVQGLVTSFKASLDEQRGQFLALLEGQRKDFAAALSDALAKHDAAVQRLADAIQTWKEPAHG